MWQCLGPVDMVVIGQRLDSVILEVFSDLNDSVILQSKYSVCLPIPAVSSFLFVYSLIRGAMIPSLLKTTVLSLPH